MQLLGVIFEVESILFIFFNFDVFNEAWAFDEILELFDNHDSKLVNFKEFLFPLIEGS